MKNTFKKLAAGSAALVVGAHANAADWSTMTGAIDFSGEITAVQAVVGLLATVAVVMIGGRKVLQTLRG